MKRCDTVMENIITWFKYLYIFHIICAGNSLLFDTPLLKVTSVLVLILGVVAVFWRSFLNTQRIFPLPDLPHRRFCG